MKNRGRMAVALLLGLLVVGPSSLLAHHSQASFDANKQVTIEGTVTEVNFSNPHTLFFIDAKLEGQGEMQSWLVEGPNPAALQRVGWNRDSVSVGDKITATGNPARSGRPLMLVQEVTTADGEHFATEH